MKKILLLITIVLVSIAIILFKYFNSNEYKIKQFNKEQGPTQTNQEYTGPNSDYLTPPNYDSI